MKEETTDFGYTKVAPEEKTRRVYSVFSSVAENYDLMNDLMSLGLHRIWKRFALAHTGLRPGDHALDLAAGTGDLSCILAKQVGENGLVTMSDINAAMMDIGRNRVLDSGFGGRVAYVLANAEKLPFPKDSFRCVTIGFGLRNVTRKEEALREMFRVLEPGSKALILEFSEPYKCLRRPYDLYSFSVLPGLGKLVAKDTASYRYLAESIRRHPNQETLKDMMVQAGFSQVSYYNLAGGIVAVHIGWKL